MNVLFVTISLAFVALAAMLGVNHRRTASISAMGWACALTGAAHFGADLQAPWLLALFVLPIAVFPAFLLTGTLLRTTNVFHRWPLLLALLAAPTSYVLASNGAITLAWLIIVLLHLLAYGVLVTYQVRSIHTSKHWPITLGIGLAFLGMALAETWLAVAIYMGTSTNNAALLWSGSAGLAAGCQLFRLFSDDRIRQLQLQLQQQDASQARQHAMLTNAADLTIESTDTGIITYVSPNLPRILGYRTEDWIGQQLVGKLHPDDQHLLASWRASAELAAGSLSPIHRIQHADGSWHSFETLSRRFEAEEGLRFIAMGRDITDRVNRQQELAAAQSRLKTLEDYSSDIFFEIGQGGIIRYVSPAVLALTGYTQQQVIGRKTVDILTEVGTTSIAHNTLLPPSSQAAGKMHTMTKANGETLWVEIEAAGFTDETGNPGLIGSIRDITARIEQQEHTHKQRVLESICQLAGGVAHDVNNLMGIIRGNAELAMDDISQQNVNAAIARLSTIDDTTERVAELTRKLLTYAGQKTLVMGSFDLLEVVRGTLTGLHNNLPGHIRLNVQASGAAVMVKADRSQLQQMVASLVANAIEACRAKDNEITVSAGLYQENDRVYACLTVADDGEGMGEATLQKIFDPFFTTREQGRGLGLAAVFGIVNAHQGNIAVESKMAKGTLIKVTLPVAD